MFFFSSRLFLKLQKSLVHVVQERIIQKSLVGQENATKDIANAKQSKDTGAHFACNLYAHGGFLRAVEGLEDSHNITLGK